jgi:hypothetical protein
VESHRRLPEARRAQGIYYMTITDNVEQAIISYRALIEKYPADATGYNNLAVALFSDRVRRWQIAMNWKWRKSRLRLATTQRQLAPRAGWRPRYPKAAALWLTSCARKSHFAGGLNPLIA